MDCQKVKVRLKEIKKLAKKAAERLDNGDSKSLLINLSTIEAHVQGIRSEMQS